MQIRVKESDSYSSDRKAAVRGLFPRLRSVLFTIVFIRTVDVRN